MKPLYKRYENEKPIGVYSSGCVNYKFFEPVDDDKLTCDYVICYEYPNLSDPRGYTRAEYRRHKVHFTASGRAYVCRNHWRVYLCDVMRVQVFEKEAR